MFWTLGITWALATLMGTGVWEVGADIDFTVGGGIELAVVIVLMTIVEVYRWWHTCLVSSTALASGTYT